MFRSNQILSKSELIKNFSAVLKHLESNPQPLLLTQRRGSLFVLVNADIFEELLEKRKVEEFQSRQDTRLREQIQHPN